MAKKVQFRIQPNESFKLGISRILSDLQLESSRLILNRSHQHISVHELRKNIKKTRAILRLIRHEIGKKKFNELNKYYRARGQDVAILRDDTSQIELLSGILQKVKSEKIKKILRKSIRQIVIKRKTEFKEFYTSNLHIALNEQLIRQNEENKDLNIKGNPNFFILKSLYKIHFMARNAKEATEFSNHEEVYHYYRKQVKYLMYMLRVLSPVNAEYFKEYLNKLNILSSYLGDLHDLDLFNNHIHQDTLIKFDQAEKKEMLKFIYRKRSYLKKRIQIVGDEIFDESSIVFSNKIDDLWKSSFEVN